MPLMNWFRGLSADVARANDELTLHAELDMVHIEVGPPEDPEAAGGGLNLPNLGNLFSGFGAKKDEKCKAGVGSNRRSSHRPQRIETDRSRLCLRRGTWSVRSTSPRTTVSSNP